MTPIITYLWVFAPNFNERPIFKKDYLTEVSAEDGAPEAGFVTAPEDGIIAQQFIAKRQLQHYAVLRHMSLAPGEAQQLRGVNPNETTVFLGSTMVGEGHKVGLEEGDTLKLKLVQSETHALELEVSPSVASNMLTVVTRNKWVPPEPLA